VRCVMSAIGTKRTLSPPPRMSAFGGKADIVALHSDIAHRFQTRCCPPVSARVYAMFQVSLDIGK